MLTSDVPGNERVILPMTAAYTEPRVSLRQEMLAAMAPPSYEAANDSDVARRTPGKVVQQ